MYIFTAFLFTVEENRNVDIQYINTYNKRGCVMYCHIKKSTINGIHDIVRVTRQLTQILLFGMGRDERRGMRV